MPSTSRSIVLSNHATEFQRQHSLVRGPDGSLFFAPINRFALTLPPEITSEIFLHCLPDADFIEPDVSSAPLVLCRICREWKRIALGTAGLWASLYIDLAWFYTQGAVQEEEEEEEEEREGFESPELLDLPVFFRDWISNARNMPLSLHVEDDPARDSDLPEDEVQSLFQMIGQRSAQWQKIVLRVSPAYFGLVCPSDSLAFRSLKHLAVPNARLPETPWMLDIPWNQLTVFRSEQISVSECVHILRNGPSLLSLTVHLCRESYPVPVTALPPLNLQILEITETSTELLTLTLVQHLTLPDLQKLALKFDTPRHTHRDLSRLIAFASRSSFPLQHLTLCLVPVPEALLIQCLHAFPSVTGLRLQLRQPADDLFRHFQYDVDLLPQLQSLHVVQNFPNSMVPDSVGLLQMLTERWGPPNSESGRKS
ncbi:hypothetical protein MVEN_01021000 [Mycena venus]|uniref:F-box domain-containing protein n=1 Tax=Mycena venus TaxID=2733690 RepID=A0A8H6Y9H3_9AGAR|nr:hypothetical protein MVEN_01021000 [Mycena venus]